MNSGVVSDTGIISSMREYLKSHSLRTYLRVIFGLIVGVTVILIAIMSGYPYRNELTVSFLNIGQGDAIFITAPNGKQMLIDGGPDDRVLAQLGNHMPFWDRNIDVVLATHPDKDHIAGLSSVFRLYDVDYLMTSEIQSDTTFDESFRDAWHHEHGLEHIIARRGERIILDPVHHVYVDILFPGTDTENWEETNEASIIVRLVYGAQSFLLTGDSPSQVEQYLVETTDADHLRSTVLKLGHHGSKNSSSEAFLLSVLPQYAIVSAGARNTYGHPAPEAVANAEHVGAHVLSTINHGTISFVTDGRDLYVDFEKK